MWIWWRISYQYDTLTLCHSVFFNGFCALNQSDYHFLYVRWFLPNRQVRKVSPCPRAPRSMVQFRHLLCADETVPPHVIASHSFPFHSIFRYVHPFLLRASLSLISFICPFLKDKLKARLPRGNTCSLLFWYVSGPVRRRDNSAD